MTDAQTLLRMIEQADPADEKALDEIDARVAAYFDAVRGIRPEVSAASRRMARVSIPQYTRSRDALKAIRPAGYFSWVEPFDDCGRLSMGEAFEARCDSDSMSFDTMDVDAFRTEELAELYAIIQSIDHERTKDV